MMSKIVCDLCNRAYQGVDAFAAHYSECTGPLNAFDVMMRASRMKTSSVKSVTEANAAASLERIGETQDCPSTSRVAPSLKRPGMPIDRPSKTAKYADMHCNVCDLVLKSNTYKMHLRTDRHKNAQVAQLAKNTSVVLISTDTKFPVETYRIFNDNSIVIVLRDFYMQIKSHIMSLIEMSMCKYISIKLSLKLYGTYIKQTDDGTNVEAVKHFSSPYHTLYDLETAHELIESIIEYLSNSCSEFQEKDSGWAIKTFNHCDMTIIKLEHIPSGGYCEMPESLRRRNAVINIKNNDNYCFKWSILAYIEHEFIENACLQETEKKKLRKSLKDPAYYRINNIASSYIKYKGYSLNFDGIEFPVNSKGIKLFEKLNPQFSINVYEIEVVNEKPKIVGPTIRSKCLKEKHISLLGIFNESALIMHYAYVTSMSTLTKTQFTKSHTSGAFCHNCLQWYTSNSKMHGKSCGKVAAVFPKEGSQAKFHNHHKKLSPPAVIYADIEAVLETYDRVQNNPDASSTTRAQKHTACAVSFYIAHAFYPDRNEMWTYQGNLFY
ncbi:hypothetical protein 1 [Drosophila-associated adintovirus 1]|uniref:C2H2-type domain-containing protein n=1 Tax=Drosophila-associated adintovirus 1 TaxID=2744816 RepID=A0A7D5A1X4_9VIRU|nr:hypothetical protein 1 [Drosophila-associated adintovirus 1]